MTFSLSMIGHLLVPFLFHEVTSLHPPSFHRNDFSTCHVCDGICVLNLQGKSSLHLMKCVFLMIWPIWPMMAMTLPSLDLLLELCFCCC